MHSEPAVRPAVPARRLTAGRAAAIVARRTVLLTAFGVLVLAVSGGQPSSGDVLSPRTVEVSDNGSTQQLQLVPAVRYVDLNTHQR